ncbi:MAG: hypothetical protein R2755_10530 [Acidimicrobiales bacterium]
MNELRWTVLDTLAVTQRNLIRLVRVPQLLVFTFIQPVLFVLMFRYVFRRGDQHRRWACPTSTT